MRSEATKYRAEDEPADLIIRRPSALEDQPKQMFSQIRLTSRAIKKAITRRRSKVNTLDGNAKASDAISYGHPDVLLSRQPDRNGPPEGYWDQPGMKGV
jgi:hypothetical protein